MKVKVSTVQHLHAAWHSAANELQRYDDTGNFAVFPKLLGAPYQHTRHQHTKCGKGSVTTPPYLLLRA